MEMSLLIGVLALAHLLSFVSPNAQGDALYALRGSLNASDELPDWYQNLVTPCAWSKVTCDQDSNVISVVMPNMGFSGTLSPEIGSIETLKTLDLQGNRITGQIPEEWGNLTSLSMLNLENNLLTGEIPSSLGNLQQLSILVLTQNNLSGSIPESLGSLPNMMNLQLGSNNLEGKVPAQLFQISKYNLSGNNLECGIKPFLSCISITPGHKSKSKTPMIVGITLSLLVILILGSYLVFIRWKGGKKGQKGDDFVYISGKNEAGFKAAELPPMHGGGSASSADMQPGRPMFDPRKGP